MDRAVSTTASPRRHFRVSRHSKLPLYHQIEVDLSRRIKAGEWQPGTAIPPEKDLCQLYGASRITVRQAIGNLVAEGLVIREAGRGTFVREPGVTAGARGLTSFTQEMTILGLRASGRLLRLEMEPANQEVADRLRLQHGEPVVVVSRLRLGDGKPIAVQTAYLPGARFPGLEQSDLGEVSLYQHLLDVYGVAPEEADELFRVAPIQGREARLLQVKSGACGFHVERLTFDAEGPYEYVVSTLRGDRYEVRLHLRAHRSEGLA